MAGRGPLPEPDSFRQERLRGTVGGWTLLPAAGRKGDAPTWPLRPYVPVRGQDGDAIASSEQLIWQRIWRTPQAVAWERLGWTYDIALYARLMALAEQGLMTAAGEVRQWSDRLGLNEPAMARLRWRIAEDELTPRRSATAQTGRPTARDRLRAADESRPIRPRRLRAPDDDLQED